MLYEPASRSRGRSPLVVMLHDGRQDAESFADATRMNVAAEEQGVFVLYPEQALSAGGLRCWNGPSLADGPPGGGDAESIAALTRLITHRHELDTARIYVAGRSAGAEFAAVLARDYPGLFAASGGPDPSRPDASREMLQSFLRHHLAAPADSG
ncbi:alpha/beta hydrolase family esterase [Ideonella sp. YS5]|uniref:alpha/beta hydrolase family esterase n=1 Tax=Ideonella sp. YS5 TaxID=3453714 RepID=UPI003EED3D46